MNLKPRALACIGVFAGLVGFTVYNLPALEPVFALPINRTLFAALCALVTTWALVYVLKGWGERP
ncbi:divalent metal cation (Fe/Co/Zn/Cd) transporter [Methylobacterium sp. BE186]|uniref:hypothetical protein n=1 Tax=Methylobacterium sp. BE186 TaxID=2817715 RepID=UPI0028606E99|nr:hypothetical protein [Methylobacterium sp. BE186]MDR7039747.1 divalent metal cation (Fe/Co/Zn/Cd) transporter [Methylobacterium sp. BE186]